MHKLSHRFTDPTFLDAMSGTGNKKAVLDLGVASRDLRDVRDSTPCYTKFGKQRKVRGEAYGSALLIW